MKCLCLPLGMRRLLLRCNCASSALPLGCCWARYPSHTPEERSSTPGDTIA